MYPTGSKQSWQCDDRYYNSPQRDNPQRDNPQRDNPQRDNPQRITCINVNPVSAADETGPASMLEFAAERDDVSNITRISKQGSAAHYGDDNSYRLTRVVPSAAFTTHARGQANESGQGITAETWSSDPAHNRVTDKNGQRYEWPTL